MAVNMFSYSRMFCYRSASQMAYIKYTFSLLFMRIQSSCLIFVSDCITYGTPYQISAGHQSQGYLKSQSMVPKYFDVKYLDYYAWINVEMASNKHTRKTAAALQ